jgi:hypothetical protein
MGLCALVPFGLQSFEALYQVIGSLDGIRARAGARDVNGQSSNSQAEPDHADLRAHQLSVGGFGDQARIGAIAALQCREGAEPGALLFDHRLQMDAALRLEPGRFERVDRVERRDGPGLHVAGAAAVEPAVLDHGLERRPGPHVERTGRHDIAMALQDQRASGLLRRTIGSDHCAGAREIGLDRSIAGQRLQVVLIDDPVVGLVAALAQQAREHVLARPFLAARARNGCEGDRSRDLRLEGGLDGGLDALSGTGWKLNNVTLSHGLVLAGFNDGEAVSGACTEHAGGSHHASTSRCRAKPGWSKKRRPGIASSRSRV